MTAITPTTAPKLSQPLAEAIRQHIAGYDAPAAPPSVRDEARQKLPDLERALEPASPAAWERFLRPLAIAVRNPPAADAIAAFATACAATLHDVPATLLTPDAQREACRRFALWPSVADLAEWLRPLAAPMRADLIAMRAIATAPAHRSAAQPMTEEQRAIATAHLATLAEQLRGTENRTQATANKPSALPPATLAAIYRADADRMAQMGRTDMAEAFRARADMLARNTC